MAIDMKILIAFSHRNTKISEIHADLKDTYKFMYYGTFLSIELS